jgi:hypothetical protein
LFDLLARRLTEFVGFDGQFLGDLAATKYLQSIKLTADQSFLSQQLLIDFGASVKNFQLVQINHCVPSLKSGVVKPAFRQPPDQGHLAALKAEADTSSGPSFLALVAFPACFAMPGTLAATKALDPVLRPRARLQIIQLHNYDFSKPVG